MALSAIQALGAFNLAQTAASGVSSLVQSANFSSLLQGSLEEKSSEKADEAEGGPGPDTANQAETASSEAVAGILSPEGGQPDAGQLKQQTETLLETFHHRLQSVLNEAGVEDVSQLQLQLDSFGDLRVAGTHPNTPEIERALSEHPELADLFRAIEGNVKLQRSLQGKGEGQGGAVFPEKRFVLDVDADEAEPAFVSS